MNQPLPTPRFVVLLLPVFHLLLKATNWPSNWIRMIFFLTTTSINSLKRKTLSEISQHSAYASAGSFIDRKHPLNPSTHRETNKPIAFQLDDPLTRVNIRIQFDKIGILTWTPTNCRIELSFWKFNYLSTFFSYSVKNIINSLDAFHQWMWWIPRRDESIRNLFKYLKSSKNNHYVSITHFN